MQPTAGDIFVIHNARLDAYTAVQITALDAGKSPQAAVLTLDWTGKAPPTEAEVAAMQPARLDFMFWKERVDHVWVPLPVPPGYLHVGNRPPLVTERVDSYGGGWSDGSLLYAQRRWDARPQASRDRFKAAVKARDERGGGVSLEGVEATRLGNEQLAAIPDLPAFDGMPLLTSIYADRPIPGIFDFLRRREFVYEAALRNHGETHVDLRGSRLLRLGIDVTGVKELHLNDELEELTLHGTPGADLRIHAEDDGRWVTHYTVDPSFVWSGLNALDTLWIRNAKDVDAAAVVRRFPALTSLRIWGAPGYLRNVGELSALARLDTLTLNDMFGFEPDAFPLPASFPMMRLLWLSSIPAEVAATVKKTWKPATTRGVNLNVRQPRKPEWLAANLDNPFRNWEDAAGITSAQATKAAALYKTARADALAVADAPDVIAALSPIVLAYTQAFNKLDARSSFIFTEEREQIFAALMQIVDAVNAQRAATGAAPVDREAVSDVMDRVRAF